VSSSSTLPNPAAAEHRDLPNGTAGTSTSQLKLFFPGIVPSGYDPTLVGLFYQASYTSRVAESAVKQIPGRLNYPVDMPGQFMLAKAEVPLLASWSRQQIVPWILHWHPRLPVTEIRSTVFMSVV